MRELFLEYASSLGFSLCFQGFDQELAGLPGDYSPPRGRLLLAESNGKAAGCVALHALEPHICEMKRLYVRPEFRGMKLGLALVNAILTEARKIGYQKIRLDEGCGCDVSPARFSRDWTVSFQSHAWNPVHGTESLASCKRF